MSDTECQLRELQAALAAKDAMILAIADRLAICSALLSRWAERPEFRRPAWHKDVKTTLDCDSNREGERCEGDIFISTVAH